MCSKEKAECDMTAAVNLTHLHLQRKLTSGYWSGLQADALYEQGVERPHRYVAPHFFLHARHFPG